MRFVWKLAVDGSVFNTETVYPDWSSLRVESVVEAHGVVRAL